MPFDARGNAKTPRPRNRDMLFRISSPLCEYEPSMLRPAMLFDPYHGIATVELAGRGSLRLCRACADAFFHLRPQLPLRSHR